MKLTTKLKVFPFNIRTFTLHGHAYPHTEILTDRRRRVKMSSSSSYNAKPIIRHNELYSTKQNTLSKNDYQNLC